MCSFADLCKGTEYMYNRMMKSKLLMPGQESGLLHSVHRPVISLFSWHLLLSRIHYGIKVVNIPSVFKPM